MISAENVNDSDLLNETFDLLFKIGNPLDIKYINTIDTVADDKPTKISLDSKEVSNQSLIPNLSPAPYLLLIDNSPIALKMLEIAAHGVGCRYESAGNSQIALKLVRINNFDLIVTDIGLPDMSGVELTHAIRKWEQSFHQKHTPIVGLTAHTVGPETQKCLDAGMDKILIKPATFKLIQEIVEEFIFSNRERGNNKMAGLLKTTGLPLDGELLEISHLPLFDLEKGIAILGSEALLKDMIILMLDHSINEEKIKITQSYAEKDWNKIQSLAHKMKGGAAYCGMIRLKMACEYFERYHKTGQTNLLEELYEQLLQAIDNTKEHVKDWLIKQQVQQEES